MDATVNKITLAALLHDIGKFALREFLDLTEDYIERNAAVYQPVFKGRYSHQHVTGTVGFLERYGDLFPGTVWKKDWGGSESLINLAAMHHRPSTALEWIITEADRICSGMERDAYEEYCRAIPPAEYRNTRLLPLFESLIREVETDDLIDHEYRYPLQNLSADAIFPAQRDEVVPTDRASATLEYRKLFEGFTTGLKKLPHREENFELWLEHFSNLLMVYTSAIPSARAGRQVPDISLYDHSRVVAAVAAALYVYHRDTDSLDIESIRLHREVPRFRFVTGDFYGIQKFIFSPTGTTQRNRAKLLRGRSAAVSIITELAADSVSRKIGIPGCSTVLNAAGRFTILAPNTEAAREAILSTKKEINDWLVEGTLGEAAFGISSAEFSSRELVDRNLAEIWERCGLENEEEKLRRIDFERFGGVQSDFLDRFDNTLSRPLCPFCGKRPSESRCENDPALGDVGSACGWCLDHINIGSQILRSDRLAILSGTGAAKGMLRVPLLNRYQLQFFKSGESQSESARQGDLLHYWCIRPETRGDCPVDGTVRLFSGYAPRYSAQDLEIPGEAKDREVGALKTFNDLAACSVETGADGKRRGVEALGLLKADVDYLGLLMNAGLREERLTLGRLASLSRQMDLFFSLWLPHFLSTNTRFANTYTLFAGGDDLLLVGPWNRMRELAQVIRDSFSQYTCFNPEIHLSAGISIHRVQTPVEGMAEAAEVALKKSKIKRDRITVFGETAGWSELVELSEKLDAFETWSQKNWVTRALFYRFNELLELAGEEKKLQDAGKVTFERLNCLKWRALLRYSIHRNVATHLEGDERQGALKDVVNLASWLGSHGAKMKIPMWEFLYNQRSKR